MGRLPALPGSLNWEAASEAIKSYGNYALDKANKTSSKVALVATAILFVAVHYGWHNKAAGLVGRCYGAFFSSAGSAAAPRTPPAQGPSSASGQASNAGREVSRQSEALPASNGQVEEQLRDHVTQLMVCLGASQREVSDLKVQSSQGQVEGLTQGRVEELRKITTRMSGFLEAIERKVSDLKGQLKTEQEKSRVLEQKVLATEKLEASSASGLTVTAPRGGEEGKLSAGEEEEEVRTLQSQLGESLQAKADLEQQVADAEKALSAFLARETSEESDLSELNLTSLIDKVVEQMEQFKAVIRSGEQEIKGAQREKQELEKALEDLTTQIRSLDGQKIDLLAREKSQEEALRALQGQVRDLQSQLEGSLQAKTGLQQPVADAEKALDAAQKEIAQQKKALEQSDAVVKAASKELEGLKQQLAEAKSAAQVAEKSESGDLTALPQQLVKSSQEAGLEEQVAALSAKVKEQEDALEELRESSAQRESALQEQVVTAKEKRRQEEQNLLQRQQEAILAKVKSVVTSDFIHASGVKKPKAEQTEALVKALATELRKA